MSELLALRLPMLEPHRASLEKCVYCPKLSRAACPVSTVEANESVTPWGKMSMAYFAARGDVPEDEAHASTAWACTGCHACRERCDHKNEVATVLSDARAEHYQRGVAPEAAVRIARQFTERAAELRAAASSLDQAAAGTAVARVLIGCGYVRRSPAVAADALRATAALVGGPVSPVGRCCGLPLLHAGDRAGFVAAARALAGELRGERTVVVDPGCARALLVEYARVGVDFAAPELFVDLAASALDRLQPARAERSVSPTSAAAAGPVRYHDPCQLGRGLGRYDQPRAILARIFGEAPREMPRHHEHAECSGGGGLLPATRPASSRAIADERIAEHHALGGGLLVTACGQSLHRLASRGEPVVDLVSLVARALP